jgi:hypothetical protein
MTKKNIQYCSLAGLGRTTALWAKGRRGFDGVAGFGALHGRWLRGLREDDGAAGLGIARVDSAGAQRRGLGEDNVVACSGMASRASERHLRHRLGSGNVAVHKGAWPWSGMMVWMLWGGLDDDTRSEGGSTMAQAPGKLLVEKFGSLTAWVKASRD